MLSVEENIRLTAVERDAPAGQVLRQYWTPAALTAELDGERPVVAVTLFGEPLVLFRDGSGQYGLMNRHCPHRGADLCFGRLEDNGLRCVFHGWKFAANGQCLEQPAEPEGSRMHERLQAKSYPVIERNGIVFAYMGQGEPPELPGFDCFNAPESHVFAFKGMWHCNWLQALEVGIDPAHASFLHRFLQDEDVSNSYGKQFRDTSANDDMPMTQLLRDYPRPEIQVDDTDFGMRLTALRHMANEQVHVRVTNHIFPCAITIPMSKEMTITQWHVPIDNNRCYWYSLFTSFTKPVDKVKMREQRLKEHNLPAYTPIKGAQNQYGYNIEEQKTQTYTGMGSDINVHDQWACESMGVLQNRQEEHLGKTDIAIIRYRRHLRNALDLLSQQETLPFRVTQQNTRMGPESIDVLASKQNWSADWTAAEADRRRACVWT